MEVIKFCLSFLLLALYSAQNGEATSGPSSCKAIKNQNPDSPSGRYVMQSKSKTQFEVYCEMGLNGGGYTFLNPSALAVLTNDEIQSMFTDRTSFLLRMRLPDGTQPYGVLTQLPEYADIPLMIGLNNHTNYYPPVNKDAIGKPYLYFGFLPIPVASNNSLKGAEVNGQRVIFDNCDFTPSGEITMFPNFREVQPANNTYVSPAICVQAFSHLKQNPSARLMPLEDFMYGETQFGGCGCDAYTAIEGVVATGAMGFR